MKTKEKIIFLLIVVFFAHGFIYLFFPDKLYESFWGKYIKYVVFVFYFLLTLSYLNWAKFFYVSGIIFSFISLAFFSHAEISVTAIVGQLNFYLPFFLLANNYEIPSRVIKKSVITVAWIAVFFSIVEYFFLKEFMIFNNHLNSEGYYRIISIYISSNGAALMFTLFIICIFTYFRSMDKKLICLLLLCSIAIIFTGSKSPLMLLALYYGFKYLLPVFLKLRIRLKLFVQLFLITVSACIFYIIITSERLLELLSLRSYSLETPNLRMISYNKFWDMVNQNFLAPEINLPLGGNSSMTSDSTYLGLWGDFGFIGLVFYLMIIAICLLKKRFVSINMFAFILAFLLTGFGMKLSFVWPFSYILFYLLTVRNTNYNCGCINIEINEKDFKSRGNQ